MSLRLHSKTSRSGKAKRLNTYHALEIRIGQGLIRSTEQIKAMRRFHRSPLTGTRNIKRLKKNDTYNAPQTFLSANA